MNKLVIPKHSNTAFKINTETDEIEELNYFDNNIDYMYLIDKDCEILFEGETYEAKEGDIAIKLYGIDGTRNLIVTKIDGLAEYAKKYAEQRLAERSKFKHPNDECKQCSDAPYNY